MLAVLVAAGLVLSVVLVVRGGLTGHPGAAGGPGTSDPARPSHSGDAHAGGPFVPPAKTVLATTHGAIPKFKFPGGPRTGKVPGSWHHARSTLPVTAQRPGWLHVRLAQRPNESTAWVLARDVTVTTTPYALVLDLASTHMSLYRSGHRAFSVPIGIGTRRFPTPTGTFFVAFFAQPPSPGYGAFVVVTSAHSNVITDWEMSGDAMVAIHGPLGSGAQIGTTGARVSHGCIRMHGRDLRHLREVPVGSPVIVRPS